MTPEHVLPVQRRLAVTMKLMQRILASGSITAKRKEIYSDINIVPAV